MKALIIDDDKTLCRWLEKSLEFVKVESLSIHSPDQLETTDLKKFDFVFVDYHLPETKGDEVIFSIREQTKEIKIVFMTKDDNQEVKSVAYAKGIDYFIRKPLVQNEINCLCEKINESLKQEDNEKSLDDISKQDSLNWHYKKENLFISWANIPLNNLSGDIQGAISLEHRTLFFTGDVMGHNNASGVIAQNIKSLITNLVEQGFSSPDEIARKINRYLINVYNGNHFLTLTIGLLSHLNKDILVEFINCGNGYPLHHYKNNSRPQNCLITTPLGMRANPELKTNKLILKRNDSLVFHSDGMIDSIKHPAYSVEEDLLFVKNIEENYLNLKSRKLLNDDYSCFVIKNHSNNEESFTSDTVTSLEELNFTTQNFIKWAKYNKVEDYYPTLLLLNELVSNAIKHCKCHFLKTKIIVRFDLKTKELQLLSNNQDPSFEINQYHAEIFPYQEGGRGIDLIKKLSNSIRTEQIANISNTRIIIKDKEMAA